MTPRPRWLRRLRGALLPTDVGAKPRGRLAHPARALSMGLTVGLALSACGPATEAEVPAARHGAQPSGGIMQNQAPPQPAGLPEGGYDAETEAQMRAVPIKFYMAHWCSVCRRARSWLARGGYNVQELDVEADEQASNHLLSVNPRGTIPMFEIDSTRVVGFAPGMVRGVLHRAVERQRTHPQGASDAKTRP